MDYNGLTPLLAAGVDTDGISSFLLTDNRDSKTYKVRRLADGDCWMSQYLKLDLSLGNLTAENTNNPAQSVVENPLQATSISNWCSDPDHLQCSQSAAWASNNGIAPDAYYYNAVAASAGHYAGGSSTEYNGDICSRGWKLPTADNIIKIANSYFGVFMTHFGTETNPSGANVVSILEALPLSYTRTGSLTDGALKWSTTDAHLWISGSVSNEYARRSYYDAGTSDVDLYSSAFSSRGDAIRCVQKGSVREPVVATCSADHICYNGNGADSGTMADQEVEAAETPADTEAVLTAPTYIRDGYAFAGWTTTTTGYGKTYGPNELVTVGDLSENGFQLYARWIKSSGTLQDFTVAQCSNLITNELIALTDIRDNKTYAVRKIDDVCWMIDNLRITGTISASQSNFEGEDFNVCKSDLTSGDSYNEAKCHESYQNVWYNFASASAGTITGEENTSELTADICPLGWKIPSVTEYTATKLKPDAFPNHATSRYLPTGRIDSNYMSYGFWWMSETGQNHPTTERVRLFMTPNSTWATHNLDGNNRNYGLSIRCIKKPDSTTAEPEP